MDLELLRTFGAPLLSAILGGLLVHFAARLRDRDNDRRRQRIDYLVDAYRALARSAHKPLTRKQEEEFENAVDDIILFGDNEQIQLSRQMIESFAANNSASLDKLLVSLRRALRRELGQSLHSLDTVPSIRLASGTVDTEAPSLNAGAEVRFQLAAAGTARALLKAATTLTPGHTSDKALGFVRELAEQEPLEAIDKGYALVVTALRRRMPDDTDANLDDIQLSILAKMRPPKVSWERLSCELLKASTC